MRRMGLAGAVRGKTVRTTIRDDKNGVRAADLVRRQFAAGAPNRLWVADFTHVATWAGTVYVAFAIDVFSRKIVGWRARMSKETDLVLDAIDRGLWDRPYRHRPGADKLVHHSDAGSQPGLNRSSQHLECEVRNGTSSWLGCCGDGSAGDAVSGKATDRPRRTPPTVLVSHRPWCDEYRRGRRGRRVARRRDTVVPRAWRSDTAVGVYRGVRTLPVVCRA